MDLGLIIALSTLGMGLIGHIITTVWWASRITQILETAEKNLMDLVVDMKAVNKTYVSKEEFAREMGHLEKRVDAAWKKLDKFS